MRKYLFSFFLCSSILFLGILIGYQIYSQKPLFIRKTKSIINQILNKDKSSKLWNSSFELVSIKSSLDDKLQKAYYYPSKGNNLRPLLVSLHTWGGNYQEFDSLAILCRANNINYIHPDFRGKNSNPEACGSDVSIKDIDDAIDFSFSNMKVDTTKIYVIGKSGGGYAALNVFMKSKHSINKVSSWVPITDLSKWYDEGIIRKSTYPEDILKCTNSKNNILNREEAKSRSPIYWQTPLRKTKLYIYAGIYDGIRGSVPITHSIEFYNKIIKDLNLKDTLNYVSNQEKLLLLTKRKPLGAFGYIFNRKIILKKESKTIKLLIFEGGHEMLTEYAFKELLGG